MRQPEAALAKLRELREALGGFERERVADALRSGSSFAAVARAMGISRQGAHRRYRDLAPMANENLRLSSHARRAVQLASQEADGAGAREVASEHLLLGVLRSGGSTSRTLEALGVTTEATRRCLADSVESDERIAKEDHAGRSVLAQAAEIAAARDAPYVEPEHIALAAVDAVDGGALRAITAIGLTPATVRERLGCSPDSAGAGDASTASGRSLKSP